MKNGFPNFEGSTTSVPTRKHGVVFVESAYFSGAIDGDMVVYFGSPNTFDCPLVRIHSECVFAEVFGSELCDCKDQLDLVYERFKLEKHGILIYLRIDGRGEGLSAKVKATELEVNGTDTFESRLSIGVDPDSRSFSAVGKYLEKKGFKKIRLLSNNPDKVKGVENAGIEVIQESLIIDTNNPEIRKLYSTKAKRFRHMIPDHYFDDYGHGNSQLSLPLSAIEDED